MHKIVSGKLIFFKLSCNVSYFLSILMWHKFKKDLFSYPKKKVNGVMGMNGIMRIGRIFKFYVKN